MIPLPEKIERTERLLRRLEDDGPLLAIRFAELPAEHREASQRFAADMMARARAELDRLREEHAIASDLPMPAAAD